MGDTVDNAGAEICGLSGSTVGATAKELIDKLFWSCYRYCADEYVPVTSHTSLLEYEKQPATKETIITKCENSVRNVNEDTLSVYKCSIKSRCIKVYMDKTRLNKQLECNEKFKKLLSAFKNSTLDKLAIEKNFQNFSKIFFYYDLLSMKKDMLL